MFWTLSSRDLWALGYLYLWLLIGIHSLDLILLNFAFYWIVLWLIILRVLYRLGLNCSILKDSTFLCISNQSKSVQNQSQSTCKYHNFCCYMIKILIPRYLYQFCWHSSAISVNKTLVCCFVVTACWRYCQSFAQRRKQAFLFIEIINNELIKLQAKYLAFSPKDLYLLLLIRDSFHINWREINFSAEIIFLKQFAVLHTAFTIFVLKFSYFVFNYHFYQKLFLV